MSRDDVTLLDIAKAARKVGTFIQGFDSEDEFLGDDMAQSAVLFQLSVIGEATKRLSVEFRDAHPEVPWRQMAGMRDRLIHGYDGIDLDLVWETAREDVPRVLSRINPLLPGAGDLDLFS